MRQILDLRFRLLSAAVAVIGLVSLSAKVTQAATYNFDVNGGTTGFGTVNGLAFDWDDTTNGGLWNTTSDGSGATTGWVQGNFPKFGAGVATDSYTVTVGNAEQIAGMQKSAANVTINATGSGALEMASGLQGVFGTASTNFIINAPITGTGGIQPNNGGNIYFYGANTYAGGTSLISSATLVYFNSSSSFGTGAITNKLNSTTGFVPLLATGGTTVTIPNDFINSIANSGLNFAANADTPVVSTGNWSLGANNLRLRNNGSSTSPLTLSGVISGAAGITVSANNSGSVVLSGANTYTGATTITGPGGAGAGTSAVRLILGASNAIASSSSVALAGGILDLGGFDHSLNATTLALLTSTNASVIDFGVGATELDLANSSGVSWTGSLLNLINWDPSVDKIRFGTDSTGLTAAQLAKIEFNGAGLGTAALDANGYLVVPEPASLSLLGLGATAILARRRRA